VTRNAIYFLACSLLLCGCGDSPRSYELAAQGIYAGALSEQSEFSLIGSLNHGASLWRTNDRERLFNWSHKAGEFSELVAAGFSPDGTRAVTTDPRTLVVWDTTSGEALAYWTTPSAVLDVALVPDGRQVFMGLEDHSAVLFDAELGDHLQTLLHRGVVGSVDVSADGKWGLTGSDDETAVLWNLADGSAVHTYQHTNPVRVVAISATGRYAFSAARNQLVAIWDGSTGGRVHTLSERNTGITTARFSADERYLLVGYVNRTIELWDVASGRRLERWNADARNPWHPTGAAILAVGFSQSPTTFYALAGDGRLVELRRS
jgi:WD40 repeat protein